MEIKVTLDRDDVIELVKKKAGRSISENLDNFDIDVNFITYDNKNVFFSNVEVTVRSKDESSESR